MAVDCRFTLLAGDGDDTLPAATASHAALSRGAIAGIVVAAVVLALFIVLFVLAKAECSCAGAPSRGNFTAVLGDALSGCERVVDVAMLGAHDAFTCGISRRSGGELSAVARTFASGPFVRLMRAQMSGADGLLQAGVRYFDVRAKCVDGDWWTHHGLLSGRLADPLRDIVRFLTTYRREFVVFDIQHVHCGPIESLLQCIAEVRYLGTNLFDLVSYDPNAVRLESLTYADVTRTGGGVVLLLPTAMTPACKHYDRGAAIRSVWHNEVRADRLLAAMEVEYNLVRTAANPERNGFRVNQAVRTPVLGNCGNLWGTICAWSLLDMAASFNRTLVAHARFTEWLAVLPIVMVDFADQGRGNFVSAIHARLGAFNAGLRHQQVGRGGH